ncbi:MAG: YraN family protein [Clostridia bacterium]|nr:YraN family protein [Clostridia bacterium]
MVRVKFTEKPLLKNLLKNEKLAAVSIGNLGEEAAVKAIKKQGYKVIERNYRTKMGEIDIIARDGEYTCFIEVRLRKNNDFGSPADTIDINKQRKIIRTAQYYAVTKKIYDTPMRFDAVLINADAKGGKLTNIKTEIIKNAFYIN